VNQQAPDGIPPLLWLVLFLLVGPPALMSKAGAKLPGFLGWVGRKWQARKDLTPEERKSSASYRVSQAEIARMAADYARISEDYEEMVAANEKRDKKIAVLEGEMTKEKRIRWAAIGYLRQVIDSHRKHAPESAIPDPPELLADIL
jgi:hypothetical protein